MANDARHLVAVVGAGFGGIYMLERHADYVLKTLRYARTHSARWLDVRPDAHREYNTELQSRPKRTVWQSGCDSWYVTGAGKHTNNWPGFTFDYRRDTRFLDPVATAPPPATPSECG